jgi:hypothetical protein
MSQRDSTTVLPVRVAQDDVRGLFADHQHRGANVSVGDFRHHRGVHHAQIFHAVYLQILVHHGHVVIAHLAGAARVIGALPFPGHEVQNLFVRGDVLARGKLLGLELGKGRLVENLPGAMDGLDPFLAILFRGQIVEPDPGRGGRVIGSSRTDPRHRCTSGPTCSWYPWPSLGAVPS